MAADRSFFSFDGAPIGAVFVCAAPPTKEENIIVDSIIRATKKMCNSTDVSYQKGTNAGGHTFYHFSSNINYNSISHRYCLYVLFDNREFSDKEQSLLSKSFGTYKFEFVVPESMYPATKPHLDFLIDTLKLPVDTTKLRPSGKSEPKPTIVPENNEMSILVDKITSGFNKLPDNKFLKCYKSKTTNEIILEYRAQTLKPKPFYSRGDIIDYFGTYYTVGELRELGYYKLKFTCITSNIENMLVDKTSVSFDEICAHYGFFSRK